MTNFLQISLQTYFSAIAFTSSLVYKESINVYPIFRSVFYQNFSFWGPRSSLERTPIYNAVKLICMKLFSPFEIIYNSFGYIFKKKRVFHMLKMCCYIWLFHIYFVKYLLNLWSNFAQTGYGCWYRFYKLVYSSLTNVHTVLGFWPANTK